MNVVKPEVLAVLGSERELLSNLTEHLIQAGAPEAEVREARVARRGLEETFLLVVVGEFNAGKSSLLNALLGAADDAPLLAEGVTPTTDRVNILVHGGSDTSAPYNPEFVDGAVDEFVLRRELPLGFLQGVALVDTPGTNAVIRRHQVITEGFLPRADLLLFLTSADRPFTESERQFLVLARSWGRKVFVVVNKVDLLEHAQDIEQVRAFVASNAREVLGLEPPVFLVSVRRFRRSGEDPGFAALQTALRETLGERERTRLKLLSPLGVVTRLLERSAARSKASLEVLQSDTRVLSDLERQLEVHGKDLQSDLEAQLKGIDALLDGVQKRGEVFIDDTLRFRKSLELLNSEKIRLGFEKTVIADVPEQLERRVNAVIDRFLERSIHFWDNVTAFIGNRAAGVGTQDADARENLIRGARFQYDRQGLLERLGQHAQVEIDGFDRSELARRLAGDAQSTVIQTGAIGAGGMGLGILIAALTPLTGIGGILLGLGAVGASALLLPRKRAQAKAELRQRISETHSRLREVLTREHRLETERVQGRLRDATAPYTQFIRAESGRIEQAAKEAAGLLGRASTLRNEIERLT